MSYELELQAEKDYQEAISCLQDPHRTSEKIRNALFLLKKASEKGHTESNIYLGWLEKVNSSARVNSTGF